MAFDSGFGRSKEGQSVVWEGECVKKSQLFTKKCTQEVTGRMGGERVKGEAWGGVGSGLGRGDWP